MLKVFLVEDESTIRETLRDTVPWESIGYTFAGEAADGEMALPLITDAHPDVLITDIRMPFMDGLSLSKLVLEEFPGTKIIILSGYDDFEYARQAIELGVEQYLLKPVTKASLMKVLREVRDKIEQEREQHRGQEVHAQDQRVAEIAEKDGPSVAPAGQQQGEDPHPQGGQQGQKPVPEPEEGGPSAAEGVRARSKQPEIK